MRPGTDTGYGDIKRRVDGTFVAATYFATKHSAVADTEQYTFGGKRIRLSIEVDRNGDGRPDADTGWREIYNGRSRLNLAVPEGRQWRYRLLLSATATGEPPAVGSLELQPQRNR